MGTGALELHGTALTVGSALAVDVFVGGEAAEGVLGPALGGESDRDLKERTVHAYGDAYGRRAETDVSFVEAGRS